VQENLATTRCSHYTVLKILNGTPSSAGLLELLPRSWKYLRSDDGVGVVPSWENSRPVNRVKRVNPWIVPARWGKITLQNFTLPGLPWKKSPCDETLALVQLRLSGAGGALKDVGIRETLGQRLPRFQRMSVPFTIISCYFLVPLCAIQELFLVWHLTIFINLPYWMRFWLFCCGYPSKKNAPRPAGMAHVGLLGLSSKVPFHVVTDQQPIHLGSHWWTMSMY